jgi:hypothetical protein
MIFLKTIFDETFVHMAVGFLGMLVAAFLVIGVSGAVGQSQMQKRAGQNAASPHVEK